MRSKRRIRASDIRTHTPHIQRERGVKSSWESDSYFSLTHLCTPQVHNSQNTQQLGTFCFFNYFLFAHGNHAETKAEKEYSWYTCGWFVTRFMKSITVFIIFGICVYLCVWYSFWDWRRVYKKFDFVWALLRRCALDQTREVPLITGSDKQTM